MKTLFITWVAPLLLAIIAKSSRFNSLDLTSLDYDITWEDITDDLCP